MAPFVVLALALATVPGLAGADAPRVAGVTFEEAISYGSPLRVAVAVTDPGGFPEGLLHYRHDPTEPWETTPLRLGASGLTGGIPWAFLRAGVGFEYQVTLLNAAGEPVERYPSPGAAGPESAGVVVTPRVEHAPLLRVDRFPGEGVGVFATVEDDGPLQRVRVLVRAVGAPRFTEFPLFHAAGSLHVGVLPASAFTSGSAYEYYVEAVDEDGNAVRSPPTAPEEAHALQVSIRSGSGGAPVPALTSHEPGESVSGVVLLQGSTRAPAEYVLVTLGGENPRAATRTRPWQLPWDTRAYADGPYRVHVLAQGLDGVLASTQVNLTVDNTPPALGWIHPAEANLTAGRVEIELRVQEANPGTLVLEVDGRETPLEAGGEGVFRASVPLAPGDHVLKARVVDAAGNGAEDEVRVTAHAPDAAPTLELVSGPEEGAVLPEGPTFTVAFGPNEALDLATLRARVNGRDATPRLNVGPESLTLKVEETGRVVVSFSVKDFAGRTGALSRIFTVDHEAPEISFLPAGGATLAAGYPAILTASFSDAAGVDVDTVRVLAGGNDVTARAEVTPAGVKYATPLLDKKMSPYVLRVEAADRLGNGGVAEATFDVAEALIGANLGGAPASGKGGSPVAAPGVLAALGAALLAAGTRRRLQAAPAG